MNEMDKVEWKDVGLHSAGAMAIGIASALLHPAVMILNAGWFLRELKQRRDKGQELSRTWKAPQVILEWLVPIVVGLIAMLATGYLRMHW